MASSNEWITRETEYRILMALASRAGLEVLIAIPGVWELLSEEFIADTILEAGELLDGLCRSLTAEAAEALVGAGHDDPAMAVAEAVHDGTLTLSAVEEASGQTISASLSGLIRGPNGVIELPQGMSVGDAMDAINQAADENAYQAESFIQSTEKKNDDGRCEHGSFFSGAGACPKCGGGAG